MVPHDTDTEYAGLINGVYFSVRTDGVWFPLTWTRVCVSLDSSIGRLVLVVDGRVLKDDIHEEATEVRRPNQFRMKVGYSVDSRVAQEYSGQYANLNVFSNPLSPERMKNMTRAGSEECGTPGDYVSWEEAPWQLFSRAKNMTVEELDGPCRRESTFNVFTAEFNEHRQCMEHCQKLGKGRSPPVRTLQEVETLQAEIDVVTFIHDNKGNLPREMWLAATDGEWRGEGGEVGAGVEAEWRDSYTGEKLGDLEPDIVAKSGPWFPGHDAAEGDQSNCLTLITAIPGIVIPHSINWMERPCFKAGDSPACPCTYAQQPILLLRGLCPHSALKPSGNLQYTPKQLAESPSDLFLLGGVSTQIRYNDSSELWIITDAVSSVRAESRATKMSYVLGRHKWNVTKDNLNCNEGQPYVTYLTLSGCSPGEFTCNDGQCVTMEQRCNQISDCRDKSDEDNCRLLVLQENYNRKVPPIIPTWGGEFNRTEVGISITLLKIVSMEEVRHKIDFQFKISLKWRENRVQYHNLKKKTSLNALTDADIDLLWLPYVIYANTDMQEAVQLDQAVKTTVVVNREGSFTRSDTYSLDEIEMFDGKDNTLSMYQTYTKSFQCSYNLQRYPFDTQVGTYTRKLIFIFYCLLKVCSIEMTTDELDLESISLVANQMMMNEKTDLTLFLVKKWTLSTSKEMSSTKNEGVRMTIVLKRKIMNEMMTTYLPAVLLILITYSTTFFKPYFFEAALSVNLTTMLVMTTIFMTVMQMLPATAYIKMIDIFLIFGQLYPFSEVVLLTIMEYHRFVIFIVTLCSKTRQSS